MVKAGMATPLLFRRLKGVMACLLGGMPARRTQGASSDALEVVHLVAQLLGVLQRAAQHACHLARQQGVRWRPQRQPCIDQRTAGRQIVHLNATSGLELLL